MFKARWVIISLLAVLVSILHLALFVTTPGERFEPLALDLWFNIRGKVPPPSEVVMVAMDEQSYNAQKIDLNQAWPRALHAKLLNRLADYGAKGAVFDILFLDQGPDPKVDQELADAIKRLPVYLGAESALRSVQGPTGSYTLEELLTPYKPLMQSAAGIALVGQEEDYGRIRRFFTYRTETSAPYLSLGEAGAGLIRPIPSKPSSRDFLWYYGPARSITTFSYDSVIQDEKPLPKEFFKDKVVYVGLVLRTAMGPAQKDVFGSPFYGELIFGSEVHATAASNLITQSWIRRLSKGAEAAILFFVTLIISGLVFALSPLWAGLVTGGYFLLWAIVSYVSFSSGLFVPGIMLSAVVIPGCFLSSTIYYYIVQRRSAQQIQSAFELYLSPEMAQQMSKQASALGLGGEKMWATALFTDIAGFTSLTEEMPAEKVSSMLNSYFTEVMDVIFQNQGTLIKFIGDAVFVIWGAPIRMNNHAELAIKTALAIQVEAKKFNDSGRFPRLDTRIGLNTGPMVIGNLGSKRRFDYTAIGDSVNLASRVEGLNKYFGTPLLLTGATRKEVGNTFNLFSVANVKVSGKKEAVELYTLFEPALPYETNEAWQKAREAFQAQRWDEAKAAFTKIASSESRLKEAAEVYLKEMLEIAKSSVPQGWQGEIIFESK